MQTDKILSAELLEKYQQGKLQPEEMQQVEKAMLQNPFLTETVEGIALSKNSFAEEVENLKKQMPYYIKNHKENNSKIVFKKSNHQEIYRLAAVILLLLTTSFTLWFFSKSSQEKSANMTYEIAQKEQNSSNNLSENSPEIPQATTADLQEKMPEKIATEISKPIIKSNEKQTAKQTREQIENESKADIKPSKITLDVKEDEIAKQPKTDLLSPQNEQIARKEVAKSPTKDSMLADLALKSRASSGADASEVANLDDIASADLEKNADKNLSDNVAKNKVVSSEAGKNKDKKTAEIASPEGINSKIASSKIASSDIKNSEMASPEMGWEKYQNYLDNNLSRKVAGAKKGKVIAEITINEKGMITNINILQSLCELCDEEVKRLLLAGGKWKLQTVKKSEKTEIIIIF